jgi:hypothetical protein
MTRFLTRHENDPRNTRKTRKKNKKNLCNLCNLWFLLFHRLWVRLGIMNGWNFFLKCDMIILDDGTVLLVGPLRRIAWG